MTYTEVMNQINTMVANGTFNYITYLNLLERNWLTFSLFVFCESGFVSAVIITIWKLAEYCKYVVKSIKQEIEN